MTISLTHSGTRQTKSRRKINIITHLFKYKKKTNYRLCTLCDYLLPSVPLGAIAQHKRLQFAFSGGRLSRCKTRPSGHVALVSATLCMMSSSVGCALCG